MQGGIRARQVYFSVVSHLMDDLTKHGVDSVGCLKSKPNANEEGAFWTDSINLVLARKRIIDRFHVNKPLDIRALGPFFKNRINDI